jgi:hypothetical protein
MKLIATLLVAVTLFASSCKKEGCTDLDALNFDIEANTDDGSCTYQSQNFVGTYNVTGYAVDQTFGDTTIQAYQFIITHAGGTGISISNLGNTSLNFNATIKNNQLNIPIQLKNVVESYSGSGVISGTTINLQYNEIFDEIFYNEVAVKQ